MRLGFEGAAEAVDLFSALGQKRAMRFAAFRVFVMGASAMNVVSKAQVLCGLEAGSTAEWRRTGGGAMRQNCRPITSLP